MMKEKYKNKYFSFLGDSITTYKDKIPAGFPTFYMPSWFTYTGISSYHDTWWGQVLNYFEAKLLVNNSWSGSYVCRPPEAEIESYGSSDSRCSGLGAGGMSPDHIIIYMGTNDRGCGFKLEDGGSDDMSVIANAYALMLKKLKRNYPQAEIWCCTLPNTECLRDPMFRSPTTYNGITSNEYNRVIANAANDAGCHLIDLAKECEVVDTIDGLHPNIDGMMSLADAVIGVMINEN